MYEYDGTQQTGKTVHEGLDDTGDVLEETTYGYNLQGRMSQTLIDEDGNGVADKKLDYGYDSDGVRVSQTVTTDTNGNGFDDETPVETKYLNDKHNATGFSQVLEEWLDGCPGPANLENPDDGETNPEE